jgi:hypothetical protein
VKRILILLLLPLLAVSVPVSAQYRVPHGVFGCGGTAGSGTNILYDTVGQQAANLMNGGGYQARLGFWYIAELESAVEAAIVSFEGSYSDDAVLLSWKAGIDTRFDGYDIYRAEGNAERFARINPERVEPLEDASYSDKTAFPGRSYSYYISAVKEEAELFRSQTVRLALPPRPVTLYQNFPNPFNPSTTISFFIPERSAVRLDIYDTAGKKVRTLTEGIKDPGKYDLEWNGRNYRDAELGSGIYFYRLLAGSKTITRKLVLIR